MERCKEVYLITDQKNHLISEEHKILEQVQQSEMKINVFSVIGAIGKNVTRKHGNSIRYERIIETQTVNCSSKRVKNNDNKRFYDVCKTSFSKSITTHKKTRTHENKVIEKNVKNPFALPLK